MKKKWMWLIGVIAIIILLAIAFILKQVNSSSEDNDGYDTYLLPFTLVLMKFYLKNLSNT